MRRKRYRKLVRDFIAIIIEEDGNTCVTGTMSDSQYLEMLDAKLTEEQAEYQESKSMEELADLLEVMQAVVQARVARRDGSPHFASQLEDHAQLRQMSSGTGERADSQAFVLQ